MEENTTILAPGRNCWIADAAVDKCGILIDGQEYYRAFHHASKAAQKYIFIAGWKFSTDVRLLRGDDAPNAGDEVKLLPFLRDLCEANPELHIHILAWDYSYIYALEWDWFLDRKFSQPHGRLQFRFDNQIPFGGSHHQKFVVIDGRVAFVGGFDFNGDDWDERNHLAENPDRADCGKHHGPYHDVQACLVGKVAEELASYFKTRWQAAVYNSLEIPPALSYTPDDVGIPIRARTVALSQNHPRTASNSNPTLQISALYADAIQAAQKLIYLENQYFTGEIFANALFKRMQRRDAPKLDIVVILPKQLPGWVEAATLEPPRLQMLAETMDMARQTGHRLGVYYSAADGEDGREIGTLIHAKLLIVDDRFMTVGSANTSNRSLGLDSELNVSWEATSAQDRDLVESIRNVRADLLAEHCGMLGDKAVKGDLGRQGGLVDHLDEVVRFGSRLHVLTRDSIIEDRAWLLRLQQFGFSFDPGRPLIDELI